MEVAGKGKEPDSKGEENGGQLTNSGPGTRQRYHLEWVTKQSRAPKSQSGTGNTEIRAALETNTANSFSLLDSIPEDKGSSGQLLASPKHQEMQMGGTSHGQEDNSRVNTEKPNNVQQTPKVPSGGSVEQPSIRPQTIVDSVEQPTIPNRNISGEKQNKTQQTPKDQIGGSAVQHSISHQILKM